MTTEGCRARNHVIPRADMPYAETDLLHDAGRLVPEDERTCRDSVSVDAVHIGGLFSVRDVPFALSRLEKVGPITVTRTDDAFILSYRPETLPSSRPGEAGQP